MFAQLWNQIGAFFRNYVARPFTTIGAKDVIDILLLAVLLFVLYRYGRTKRAGRVMVGLAVVVVLGAAVTLTELTAMGYIVRLFASAFAFCFVLIFQPEIRTGLEKIGNSRLAAPLSDTLPRRQYPAAKQVTAETVDAVCRMSNTCTGALIVFEGLTKLGNYTESGKIVDARVTSHLLQNIFYDKAPLHDGAVVIRDMRIYAASCVLPSTASDMDFGSMGTRHRAAVGVTEVSDALVIVVSEQTGIVSVAQDGKLLRGVDRKTLTDILMTYLAGNRYLRTKRLEEKAEARRAEAERAAAAAKAAVAAKIEKSADAAVQEPDSAAGDEKKSGEENLQ